MQQYTCMSNANLMGGKKREIMLHGTITKAADYNTLEIFSGLPVKPRSQIIEIVLDEDFWQILFLRGKKVRIIVDESIMPT